MQRQKVFGDVKSGCAQAGSSRVIHMDKTYRKKTKKKQAMLNLLLELGLFWGWVLLQLLYAVQDRESII